MENTLFKGGFPIETPICSGFPTATFDYRRVSEITDWIALSKIISKLRILEIDSIDPPEIIHGLLEKSNGCY